MSGIPFRRAELLAAVATIALVTLVTALDRMPEWYGSWGESGSVLEDATTLTYPLTAALAAWLSSAPRRRKFDPLLRTASRSLRGIYLRSAMWLGGAAALGSLIAAAVVYVITAREATYAGPSFLVPGVICCGFWAVAALGLCASMLLPSYVAPVVALVLVYALEVFADTGNPNLAPLAGLVIADGRERTYLYTLEWVLVVRSAWLIAIGVLLVTVAARRASQWLVAFSAACLVSVPLLLTGDSAMEVDRAATMPACKRFDTSISICLTAARAHAADEVWAALRPELVLLDGFNSGQYLFVEENLRIPTPASGTLVVPFGIVNGSTGDAHQVNTKELQSAIASQLLTGKCAPSAPSPSDSKLPPATATDVIHYWLLRQLKIPTDGSAAIGAPVLDDTGLDYSGVAAFRNAWDRAGASQRSAWLALNRSAIATCDLSAPAMDAL